MAREKDAAAKGEGGADDPVRYAAAVEEIEAILASIDRDEIDLDQLAAKVERAVDLLKVCRAKLKSTEARVVEVLKDLADDATAAADGDLDPQGEASASDDAEGEGDDEAGGAPRDDAAAKPPRRPRKKKPDDDLPF